jgi:hypothetical protein
MSFVIYDVPASTGTTTHQSKMREQYLAEVISQLRRDSWQRREA